MCGHRLCRSSKWAWGPDRWEVEGLLDHQYVDQMLKYLVKWKLKADGTAYEDSWEPASFISPILKRNYHGLIPLGITKVVKVSVDVSPLAAMVLGSARHALKLAKTACRPRVHAIPLPELSLPELAVPVLEILSEPWLLAGQPAAGRAALTIEQVLDTNDGVETWQLWIKKLADISDFCNLGAYMHGAAGLLRYDIGRDSNIDIMGVGTPVVITVSTTRTGGLATCKMEFPTVHFNGDTGQATFPHMTKGTLKSQPNREKFVTYANSLLPAGHDLKGLLHT